MWLMSDRAIPRSFRMMEGADFAVVAPKASGFKAAD
jgi:catalase